MLNRQRKSILGNNLNVKAFEFANKHAIKIVKKHRRKYLQNLYRLLCDYLFIFLIYLVYGLHVVCTSFFI